MTSPRILDMDDMILTNVFDDMMEILLPDPKECPSDIPDRMWKSCSVRQTGHTDSTVCVLWEQCLPRFVIQHRLERMRRFQSQGLLHGRAF